MDGDPVLIRPTGTNDYIALGSAGAVFLDDSNRDRVVKAPLKHDVEGCSHETVQSVRNKELFSEECINREKLIYQTLPKHPNILECLSITERGLLFPYYRLGNLREFMRKNEQDVSSDVRDKWIKGAIDAIAWVHEHGVVHANISPRNFLVAEDLSIKLCDFAGSVIGDLEQLVQEEDWYQISPWSPRNHNTDLFALGCLIYEISTGERPYNEIDDCDSEEIERRYAAQQFPKLDGLRYQNIIFKCWSAQYPTVAALRSDWSQLVPTF
ncbi:hypothetical protein N7461_000236 [Penicillium sp. DV-2018c]|nr:hypothetical protein N7461_000236 [Penicillium sp. DV-2018c]